MEGNVKWFNRKKGYGFVEGDDGQEYFVHHSGLAQGTFIRDNDRVSFDPTDGEKGKQAQNVTLLQKGSERTDLPAEEATEAPAEESETTEEATEEPAKEEAPVEEETPAEEVTEEPAEEEAPADEATEEPAEEEKKEE